MDDERLLAEALRAHAAGGVSAPQPPTPTPSQPEGGPSAPAPRPPEGTDDGAPRRRFRALGRRRADEGAHDGATRDGVTVPGPGPHGVPAPRPTSSPDDRAHTRVIGPAAPPPRAGPPPARRPVPPPAAGRPAAPGGPAFRGGAVPPPARRGPAPPGRPVPPAGRPPGPPRPDAPRGPGAGGTPPPAPAEAPTRAVTVVGGARTALVERWETLLAQSWTRARVAWWAGATVVGGGVVGAAVGALTLLSG